MSSFHGASKRYETQKNNVDVVVPALLGESWPSVLSLPSVSIHPPEPFYQSPVGTVSQSGQASPLLCPCTG